MRDYWSHPLLCNGNFNMLRWHYCYSSRRTKATFNSTKKRAIYFEIIKRPKRWVLTVQHPDYPDLQTINVNFYDRFKPRLYAALIAADELNNSFINEIYDKDHHIRNLQAKLDKFNLLVNKTE